MMKKQTKKKRSNKKAQTQQKQSDWQARMIVLLFVLVLLGGFGWWWKQQILLQQVHVEGAYFSEPDSIKAIADLDTTMLFFSINPHFIAERVSQNPWVESASVRRLPNAALTIVVRERRPALLALNSKGQPDRFIDSNGYQMPFKREATYDVPLLMGLHEEYRSIEPVQHPVVISLLNDLNQITDDIDALISTFTIKPNGEIYLQTNPIPGRGSIDVRLGKENFAAKLSKLHAFWHQTVLAKREYNIHEIDLRFDSQIVTQEVRLSQ